MSILFVRHGEAFTNVNIYGGTVGSDLPLTLEGIRQSKDIARYLSRLAISQQIDFHPEVYTSPFHRTIETAHIIADVLQLDVVVDERLRDTHKGGWQGLQTDDVRRLESRISPKDRPFDKSHGGENWEDVAIRVSKFASEVIGKCHLPVIAVSHNDPIKYGIGALTHTPIDLWNSSEAGSKPVTEIDYDVQFDIWATDTDSHTFNPLTQ